MDCFGRLLRRGDLLFVAPIKSCPHAPAQHSTFVAAWDSAEAPAHATRARGQERHQTLFVAEPAGRGNAAEARGPKAHPLRAVEERRGPQRSNP